MYALVEILGKQYKVQEGDTVQVDKISEEKGTKLSYTSVLAVIDEKKATFGTPYVKGASVEATLVGEELGDKVKIYKYKRRKGYRRTQGHREQYSLIKIEKIEG